MLNTLHLTLHPTLQLLLSLLNLRLSIGLNKASNMLSNIHSISKPRAINTTRPQRLHSKPIRRLLRPAQQQPMHLLKLAKHRLHRLPMNTNRRRCRPNLSSLNMHNSLQHLLNQMFSSLTMLLIQLRLRRANGSMMVHLPLWTPDRLRLKLEQRTL